MHHFSKENLQECFDSLKRTKAVVVDGITKADYQEDIDKNLEKLIDSLKNMSYRPEPVRRVEILKEDGSSRPIGISCTEDKIIQEMSRQVLEAIYDFVRTAFPNINGATNGFREVATVKGNIYDTNGLPLSSVTLTGKFTRPDYFFTKVEKSIENGSYVIYDILLKPYGEVQGEITASKEGYKSKTRIVTIKSNLTDPFINMFNFGGPKEEEKPYALEKL